MDSDGDRVGRTYREYMRFHDVGFTRNRLNTFVGNMIELLGSQYEDMLPSSDVIHTKRQTT